MSEKSWRPRVVAPERRYLHENYGMSEERRLELSKAMDALLAGPTRVFTIHSHLDALADLAESEAEFAWMVFTTTWFLVKNGYVL